MLSINRREYYGKVYNDVRCLSTDAKPTDNIKNGSVLTEIDTGNTYLFDAAGKSWHKIEGGGGSGLSVITVPEVHEITGVGD